MKRTCLHTLVIVAPLLVTACDAVDDPDDLDAAAELAEPDELADADEDAAPAGHGPEDLAAAPEAPQENILCDLLCLLQSNQPTCGSDGELYAKPCLATCESGGATPPGTYWPDGDGDGFGDADGDDILACELSEGLADNNDDCDDAQDEVFPGQTETCDGVDNDCEATSICTPTSCAGLQTEHEITSDGENTLYVGGDPAKPWTAYCHDMAGTASTYLTLQATGPGLNYSQFLYFNLDNPVTTTFSRVRIDPATLNVDIDDLTFSQSSGGVSYNGRSVTSMPYAAPETCDGLSAHANVDLTGTPFKVTDTFTTAGSGGSATATPAQNGQVVNLEAHGFCRWIAPTGANEPYLRNSGAVLQLGYITP